MNGNSIPTYDPADVIITHALKDWVRHTELPAWVRAQVLSNATQSAVKVSSRFVVRMVFKWILLCGVDLISFLLADDAVVFIPSRENYYYNPPHLKPCAVHARVLDTFLLEAGMIGAI